MGAPHVPPGMRPPVRKPAGIPWWQREGVISRLLAVAGVGVTLVGVVMLLVLAAQAGIFGPVPRVVAGAVFSGALVAVGMRVYGRAGGHVGGIALAATGFAGAYLDVVAVTSIYEWLPRAGGLGLAFAIAAGGVALALRWNAQALAVLVVAGAALLAPVVTSELVLLGFLIVLQLTCVPVQLVKDWPALHVVRTLPAVLATLLYVAIAGFDSAQRDRVHWVLVAAVVVALIGLAGTLLVVRKRPGDLIATVAFAISTIPLLAVVGLFDRVPSMIIAGAAAVVLTTVATLAMVPKLAAATKIPAHTGIAAAVTGAFALLEVCVQATEVQTAPIALFLVAIGYLGVAGQRRNRVAAGIGGVFALLGALTFLSRVDPETLATQRLADQYLNLPTALAAVLGVAVLAVAVWGLRRTPALDRDDTGRSMLLIVAGAAGLYAVTATTVSIGIATGAADGFVLGHSAATILWMAAATSALLYGLRNLARSAAIAKVALGSGLLVTAAALAKLFLFDLATLDGLVRVAAFLVVGVLLLLAGTRYARAFAEASTTNPPSR
ncbi:DUF2339 domain-containing protein [Nocardia sp. NPDC051832]|uniref:DUF2339 domain-containing protein n=1 Tax=Nocardia sp. NPDC051832 TaxID=3155673 RepID=UPI00344407CD